MHIFLKVIASVALIYTPIGQNKTCKIFISALTITGHNQSEILAFWSLRQAEQFIWLWEHILMYPMVGTCQSALSTGRNSLFDSENTYWDIQW